MKTSLILLAAILTAGCSPRNDPDTLVHGMKWSIAQRDLEQNGWIHTLTQDKPTHGELDKVGYRYVRSNGHAVDIVTEKVGEVEKIYRMFTVDGREIDAIDYKPAPDPTLPHRTGQP